MIDSQNVYQKADSFVEIRQQNPNITNIYKRIVKLYENINSLQMPDHQYQIVKRACEDIIGKSNDAAEARFMLHDYTIEEIMRLQDDLLPRYLFYRYRYEIFPQQKKLDDYPPCLQIEPASICNYRCVFCYQTDKELTNPKNGHMGLMSLGLFKKIVDEVEGKCEAVTLASRGEPLINKQIDKMLAYTSGRFLALKINTNAWFLDERKAHAILQAGVNTLVFSADAAEEPLYSKLRVNGKLDRVLSNIRQFQEIRAKHYPESKMITRVSGVKFSKDQDMDAMEKHWGELVDQVAFVEYNPWENTYQRAFNDIVTPCSDLWRRTFVWFDGTVNPCDVDYQSTLSVGNINDQQLSDIWTGKEYFELREAHLAKERSTVSPCNRCTLV